MAVTSDSLFHFTTSLSALQGILTEKFKLTYCREEYTLDYQTHTGYYPMVTFCDLPLSAAKDHIAKYGSYAIGLTKSWGIKNKLNPVVYLEQNSMLSKDVQATLDKLIPPALEIKAEAVRTASVGLDKVREIFKSLPPTTLQDGVPGRIISKQTSAEATVLLNEISASIKGYSSILKLLIDMNENFGNIFRYIKNYHGPLNRGDNKELDYRFYDEREWRYVPALAETAFKSSFNEKEYLEFRGTDQPKPFVEGFSLAFSCVDIKYLIVNNDQEIPALIETINKTDNLVRNAHDALILTTKIMTVDQLNKDF